jgi:hypothetical protein
MQLPTSLVQNHIAVTSSSLNRTVSIDIHGPQSQPPFKVNIINILQSPIPQSSLSFSVANTQRIIKIQSSRIHKHISISLESAFSNVILKRCNLIPVFHINWFFHEYQSLNLDVSILLSPETFRQRTISSQQPRAFLLCKRFPQTLSLASYILHCQLSINHQTYHLALSCLLHCYIAGFLDPSISRRLQRLKDGGNVKLLCRCNCRISIWRDSTQLPSFKTLNRAGMKAVIFSSVVSHLIGGELFSKLQQTWCL